MGNDWEGGGGGVEEDDTPDKPQRTDGAKKDTREGTRDQKEEEKTTGRPVMRGGRGEEEGWSEVTSRRSGGWRRGREQLVLQWQVHGGQALAGV